MTNYGKHTVTSKLKWWRRNQFHGQVRTMWELCILNSIKLFNFSGKHTFKIIIFQEHTFSPSFYNSLVSIWTIHARFACYAWHGSWRAEFLKMSYSKNILYAQLFDTSLVSIRNMGRAAWPFCMPYLEFFRESTLKRNVVC